MVELWVPASDLFCPTVDRRSRVMMFQTISDSTIFLFLNYVFVPARRAFLCFSVVIFVRWSPSAAFWWMLYSRAVTDCRGRCQISLAFQCPGSLQRKPISHNIKPPTYLKQCGSGSSAAQYCPLQTRSTPQSLSFLSVICFDTVVEPSQFGSCLQYMNFDNWLLPNAVYHAENMLGFYCSLLLYSFF